MLDFTQTPPVKVRPQESSEQTGEKISTRHCMGSVWECIRCVSKQWTSMGGKGRSAPSLFQFVRKHLFFVSYSSCRRVEFILDDFHGKSKKVIRA